MCVNCFSKPPDSISSDPDLKTLDRDHLQPSEAPDCEGARPSPGLRLRVSISDSSQNGRCLSIGRETALFVTPETTEGISPKARDTFHHLSISLHDWELRYEALSGGAGALSETVEVLFAQYVKAKAKDKKGNRTLREVEQMFAKHVLPVIGKHAASRVTRRELTRLIDCVAERSPGAARSVHARVRAFYSWAMPRLDGLAANPATYAGRPRPAPSRDRVLTDEELAAVWAASGEESFPWRPAVRLLILTGQRRSEVFNADRAEFDFQEAIWNIPAERQKNGVRSIVPLSRGALNVLRSTPAHPDSGKLFPASRGAIYHGPSGFSRLMQRLRSRVRCHIGGPVDHWQLHDLRRTMATNMQKLGVRLEVTESVLNHVSGTRSGVAGIYQRYDWALEKRAALDLWASKVEQIAEES